MVTRHLRHVIETSNGARLCSQAITANIYRFFLDDMAQRGLHRPPDSLAGTEPGTAGHLVTGVRGSDAAAFVDWVNEITGNQATYRLPTLTEIEDPVTCNTLTGWMNPLTHCIWLAPEGPESTPQLGTPRDAPQPWTISGATVQQRLVADFRDAALTLSLSVMIRASVITRILRALDPTTFLARDRDHDVALTLVGALARDRDRALDLAHASEVPMGRALSRMLDPMLFSIGQLRRNLPAAFMRCSRRALRTSSLSERATMPCHLICRGTPCTARSPS